jgi:D-tyrosyl-tRNA(Tyr) deacylase
VRAVVQRVTRASVEVDEKVVGAIPAGLCVFVGFVHDDTEQDAGVLARKVAALRIFVDDEGKMNRSVKEAGGAILAVSQFTLAGDVRKGNRPSFASAMAPDPARSLFDRFCEFARGQGLIVETGQFRAHMEVALVNDGPVTILLDTRRAF